MEAREHQLDVACRIADTLFENASDEAMALFDELEWPTAVFEVGQRAARSSNAAWRKLLPQISNSLAIASLVDDAAKRGESLHRAEVALELGGHPGSCAVTLRRSRARTSQVIVACTDITDEVVARQLAVNVDALVWSGPHSGELDYRNRRWAAYVSNHPRWQQAIHRDDLAKCTKGLSWALHERGSSDIEARLCRTDGEYRWHRIRFTASTSGSRWFGTANDIHDTHEAQVERDELLVRLRTATVDAAKASRLKDQFLAVVSHELRAPLTAMVLWEGILRDDTTSPALRTKALEAIRLSALSQSRVVEDLLDVSRAIAGKLHIDLRPVEISSLVREAIDAIAPSALVRHVAIELRDTVVDGEVNGDALRLRQILDNVLSNAVKFSDPGGVVTVSVIRHRGSIVISIADTGCGIAAELLPQLFDPFSQSENALTRTSGGLGLGLSITKQLVDLHGGTVVASSDGPGRGATLTIALASTVRRRKSTPPAGVPTVPKLARARVLVVDDDERVRDALGVLLDRAGAVVDTAESAAAARLQIARRAPDVLVCDIAMPGEDGYTFMSSLRTARNDVGAIALSAYTSEVDVSRALAAGFDRHLAKPVDFARLVVNIDELLVARGSSRHP